VADRHRSLQPLPDPASFLTPGRLFRARRGPSRPDALSRDERRALASWGVLAVRQALISSTTVAAVFGLALLLEPADFAVYGYAASLMLIAAVIGDLGLGGELIRSGVSDARIERSFGLQLAVWTPVCALGAIVAITAGAYGLTSTEAALLATTFFVLALQSLPTALLEVRLAFPTIAVVEVVQRVVFVAGALTFAALARSSEAIPIAAALAAGVGYAGVLIAVRWRWRPRVAGTRGLFFGFSSYWWQGRLASQLNYAIYPLLGGWLFSQREVGLIVWALGVSSLPALLAPLAARAVFPTIAQLGREQQVAVFRRVFRASLLVGFPGAAATLALAEPITLHIFGESWRDAIVLLRLESVTTALGIALTPCVPLLYLVDDPARVRRLLVGWAAANWTLTPLLAVWLSYVAPSVAQIVTALVVVVLFDRILRRRRGYGLVRDLLAGVVGLVIAAAVGQLLVGFATDVERTVVVAAVVIAVQALVALAIRALSERTTRGAPMVETPEHSTSSRRGS
jgi:O-antigen/teichoic acid export membrane protein